MQVKVGYLSRLTLLTKNNRMTTLEQTPAGATEALKVLSYF